MEFTPTFESWWNTLDKDELIEVSAYVNLLKMYGVTLRHPYSSGIKDSKYTHLRELRIQCKGEPYRILYAFDPRRIAILLLGGNKTGNDRWYKEYVPIADKLYKEHLESLKEM